MYTVMRPSTVLLCPFAASLHGIWQVSIEKAKSFMERTAKTIDGAFNQWKDGFYECQIAKFVCDAIADDAIAQQCLDSVLDGMLTPLLESSQPCTARAVHALGWLTKALAMRGHPRVQECLLRVLQLLGAPGRMSKAGGPPLSLSTVSDHAGIAASLSAESGTPAQIRIQVTFSESFLPIMWMDSYGHSVHVVSR